MVSGASSVILDALQSQWGGELSEAEMDGLPEAAAFLEGPPEDETKIHVAGSVEGGWEAALYMPDRLGILSLVAGIFTSAGLNITRADTFSLSVDSREPEDGAAEPSVSRPARRFGVAEGRPVSGISERRRRGAPVRRRRPLPRRRGGGSSFYDGSRRALMLFTLESLSEGAPDWETIEGDIRAVVRRASAGEIESARLDIIDRFTEMARSGDGGVRPMDVEARIASSGSSSQLEVRSVDTPGFLLAFANALASLRVNVVRARIRTDADGRIRDTFWLSGQSGEKIEAERRLRQIEAAALLIKRFTNLLPLAPDPGLALRQFSSLMSQTLERRDWAEAFADMEGEGVLETLARALGSSRFLWEDFLRMQRDNLFPVLLDSGGLDADRGGDEYDAGLDSALAAFGGYEDRIEALNRFKDREMFRSDLRYITDRTTSRQFAAELTALSDVTVRRAFELCVESLSGRHGVPRLEDGSRAGYGVFALGKFGGMDMGFGSDIELIFVYEAEGYTDGEAPVRNSTFFEETVKEFLKALATRRQGIFEIDMRLRPYGSKGPLASSLAAFRAYYAPEGDARQFERLALVRMRPVAGDRELAALVMAAQDAFVYSDKPLDLEDIRHMRFRQADELVTPGAVNAKLSPGGVVDIEYYVQAWQIARGGNDAELRSANTLDAVDSLRRKGHLSAEMATGIGERYEFLKRLIDGLRMVRGNAKDLDIPPADSREFRRLAQRMEEETPERFGARVSRCMAFSQDLWKDSPPPSDGFGGENGEE